MAKWYDKQAMIDLFKRAVPLKENEVYLGKKRAEIRKLSPSDFKHLMGSIEYLPSLVYQVVSARKNNDLYVIFLQAADMAMDEIVNLVSVITDIDEDYIYKNVGLDELYEFLKRMTEFNNFNSIVQNVKNLYLHEKEGAEDADN
ncbi:hypothetical protein [Lentibacillus saliphilus]|uniref:hypothetical protein n=1 Tax=Lentibacillus saliphilus TaxID=2737028 RepID=UPI001C2FDBA3|nr:hypothetical protein [Lentibacillus saliphilus]